MNESFSEMKALVAKVVAHFDYDFMSVDNLAKPQSIVEQIAKTIESSDLVIADVSIGNPNVLYEVGLATGLRKNIVLLAGENGDLPFDLRSLQIITYKRDHLEMLEKKLSYFLSKLTKGEQIAWSVLPRPKLGVINENINISESVSVRVHRGGELAQLVERLFSLAGFDVITEPGAKDRGIDAVIQPRSNMNFDEFGLTWLVEVKAKEPKISDLKQLAAYVDKKSQSGILVTEKAIPPAVEDAANSLANSGTLIILLSGIELRRVRNGLEFLDLITAKFTEKALLARSSA